MQILLNGEHHSISARTTVTQLIEDLKLTERRLAVELNGEILPRSKYAHSVLVENDNLEIVNAIGGGQSRKYI